MPASVDRAAVCGATGYIGAQCVEISTAIPPYELTRLLGRSSAGKPFAAAVPGSRSASRWRAGWTSATRRWCFAALPHTVAAAQPGSGSTRPAWVVDMSADFRLTDPAAYARWYGLEHSRPGPLQAGGVLLGRIPPRGHCRLRPAGHPGLLPRPSLLSSLPRCGRGGGARRGDRRQSGASGGAFTIAGFPLLGGERIGQGLRCGRPPPQGRDDPGAHAAAGRAVRLTFVPHLIPMTRGILATTYLHPSPGARVATTSPS